MLKNKFSKCFSGNPEEINKELKLCGYSFPELYINTQIDCNGGVLEDIHSYGCYYDKNLNYHSIYNFDGFLGFGRSYPYEKFIEILNAPPEFFPKGIVAFGIDGGGNLFCFDYRENPDTDNPPIVFWHVEGDGISLLANDFDELMNNLKSEEEAMKELEELRKK